MAAESALSADAVAGFARRLDEAQLQAREIDSLVQECSGLALDDAYKIQSALIARRLSRGETIAGYKMGLTSKAKMEQMGIRSPIYGVLTDAMRAAEELSLRGKIHPKIEPEIAFRLGRELGGRPSPEEALAACSGAAPALEILDSRYRNFKFTLPDVVADNASSCAFAVGPWRPVPSMEKLGALKMVLSEGGVPAQVGLSSAILGHPAASLAELASLLSSSGVSLPAGCVVLAGAATSAIAVKPGNFELRVDGFEPLNLRVGG
ncbi:MAG: fumarylacetoacetate hydrolase family protein [Elusimicrobia bacterium]|nr:fumarylacetoacetate hydrolase family protein [Elusimicrobiota bacterium]